MQIKSGIINIDKAAGITSQDVVAAVRRKLRAWDIRKVGHTGTLDPMATGVLPVCFGKATRIIEYFEGDFKEYSVILKLGAVTDTFDATGTFVQQNSYEYVNEQIVRKAFSKYDGVIEQVPPIYSALKLEGRPLYEYARRGEHVDLSSKKRKVYLSGAKIIHIDIRSGEVEFSIKCSKGTYIRSICYDIGRDIGCGAYMKSLRRTGSGVFTENSSISIENVMRAEIAEFGKMIIPMDYALVNLGIINLDVNYAKYFVQGRKIGKDGYEITSAPRSWYPYRVSDSMSSYRVYAIGGFIGVAGIGNNGELFPKKVIADGNI